MSALSVVPSTSSVVKLGSTQFVASGGVAPYYFSLVSGLGSLDPITGVYTSTAEPEIAIISVTDSDIDPATVQVTVVVASVLTLFCDVIAKEMGLGADQVYLYNQKFNTPIDSKLYVAVRVMSCKPFSNTKEIIDVAGVLTEVLSSNFLATLSINIMSRGPDARDRKEEVILALNSTYSQQQQEANGFYIAPISSNFLDLSEIDGAAIPYRFNISLAIQYQISKKKAVPYYDTFLDPTVLVET